MNKKEKIVETVDPEYRNLNQMTLAGWLDYHQKKVVFDKVSWMGIPTLKNVLDLWVYQELIYSLRPDLIIEMGSFKGGSTLYLAHLLEQLGQGQIISVDLDHSHFLASHARITTLTGSTQDPGTIIRLKEAAAGLSVMIIHDADHSRDMVLADLQAYADLVSKDSYFIVEDGVVDLFPEGTLLGDTMGGPGPLPAIREFLEQDHRFIIDRSCERYLLTYNPCGYLKKIAE
ncbi:class I SAM-dependent methyltransferase [bacterium]|nr:class I SAM-dependent methyltransferase [bacterium]